MGSDLNLYLDLERRMLAADDRGDDEEADRLRDEMDPIWYQISDEERAWLNARSTEIVAGFAESRMKKS